MTSYIQQMLNASKTALYGDVNVTSGDVTFAKVKKKKKPKNNDEELKGNIQQLLNASKVSLYGDVEVKVKKKKKHKVKEESSDTIGNLSVPISATINEPCVQNESKACYKNFDSLAGQENDVPKNKVKKKKKDKEKEENSTTKNEPGVLEESKIGDTNFGSLAGEESEAPKKHKKKKKSKDNKELIELRNESKASDINFDSLDGQENEIPKKHKKKKKSKENKELIELQNESKASDINLDSFEGLENEVPKKHKKKKKLKDTKELVELRNESTASDVKLDSLEGQENEVPKKHKKKKKSKELNELVELRNESTASDVNMDSLEGQENEVPKMHKKKKKSKENKERIELRNESKDSDINLDPLKGHESDIPKKHKKKKKSKDTQELIEVEKLKTKESAASIPNELVVQECEVSISLNKKRKKEKKSKEHLEPAQVQNISQELELGCDDISGSLQVEKYKKKKRAILKANDAPVHGVHTSDQKIEETVPVLNDGGKISIPSNKKHKKKKKSKLKENECHNNSAEENGESVISESMFTLESMFNMKEEVILPDNEHDEMENFDYEQLADEDPLDLNSSPQLQGLGKDRDNDLEERDNDLEETTLEIPFLGTSSEEVKEQHECEKASTSYQTENELDQNKETRSILGNSKPLAKDASPLSRSISQQSRGSSTSLSRGSSPLSISPLSSPLFSENSSRCSSPCKNPNSPLSSKGSPVSGVDSPASRSRSTFSRGRSPVSREDSPVYISRNPLTRSRKPLSSSRSTSPVSQADRSLSRSMSRSPSRSRSRSLSRNRSPLSRSTSPVSKADRSLSRSRSRSFSRSRSRSFSRSRSPLSRSASPLDRMESPVSGNSHLSPVCMDYKPILSDLLSRAGSPQSNGVSENESKVNPSLYLDTNGKLSLTTLLSSPSRRKRRRRSIKNYDLLCKVVLDTPEKKELDEHSLSDDENTHPQKWKKQKLSISSDDLDFAERSLPKKKEIRSGRSSRLSTTSRASQSSRKKLRSLKNSMMTSDCDDSENIPPTPNFDEAHKNRFENDTIKVSNSLFKKKKRKSKPSVEANYKKLSTPSSSKNETLVGDIYTEVNLDENSQLSKICSYVLKRQIPVGLLNTLYTNNCRPTALQRRSLLKYCPSFKCGKFLEHEDGIILKGVGRLVDEGLVTDKTELLIEIANISRVKPKPLSPQSRAGVKNILGIYVGQGILENRLAGDICERLAVLLSGDPWFNKPYRRRSIQQTGTVEPYQKPEGQKLTPRSKWTCDEDKELTEYVLKATKVTAVQDIVESKIDWLKISEKLDRNAKLIRKHWIELLQPILVLAKQGWEDELDFKKEFVESILKMDVSHRKEINWKALEERFSPRSSLALQNIYNALVSKLVTKLDCSSSHNKILRKVLLSLNGRKEVEEKRKLKNKKTKREIHIEEVQEHYLSLIEEKETLQEDSS